MNEQNVNNMTNITNTTNTTNTTSVISNMQDIPIYSFEDKERIVHHINKLKKKKYFNEIEQIIIKYNPDINITITSSGKYLYFHNLNELTYYNLDMYIKNVSKL